jgi:diguanylate cyclase (GGDEF)-like protein
MAELISPQSLWVVVGLGLLLVGIGILWMTSKLTRLLNQLDFAAQKILRYGNLDPLTALPERALFFETLQSKIKDTKKNNEKLALLFCDIDNFRGIKDAFGFALSDILIEMLSKRLLLLAQHNPELLARLGSDQFAIVLPACQDEKKILDFATLVSQTLSEPFFISGRELTIGVSIGISIFPQDGEDVEKLLKHADVARQYTQKSGGNAFNFYVQESDNKIDQEQKIVVELRKAIQNNTLELYYQPKVDVKTRRITSAEALLHWEHPTLGVVSPANFIPLAEKSGLILSIGNWVIAEACRQTKEWQETGFADFSIAINLSAYQFNAGDVAEKIAEVIWKNNLDPAHIEIELTESLMMENVEKTQLMLSVLKTMGVKISIDDFGTGYSSLSQIRKFFVNSIKIDQSFIRNINANNKNQDDRPVVKTIIAMAKQLNLKVIAEGVETEEQFSFLKEEGCDLIQGYLFSRPISAEAFKKLMTENWEQFS